MQNKLTYQVPVEYFVQTVDVENGGKLVEQLKSVDVEVMRLQRTNRNHTRVAMRLFDMREAGWADAVDFSVELAGAIIYDENIRKEILKDAMACFSLYNSDEVQEDIARFFENWDLAKKMNRNEGVIPNPDLTE